MSQNTEKLIVAGLGTLAVLGGYAFLRQRRRYDLQGKVVLITGGSRGLGLVLAREFADRGARVAICARDADELERARTNVAERGGECFAAVCDVRDAADVKRLAAAVHLEFGPTDVLVNCAGVIQVGPLETQTRHDFEDMMAVHFWGPYNTMQEVVPAMRSRGDGRIVNISSIGGKIAVPHLSAYSASKFALAGLSSAFGVELAKEGIRVTTVYPGLMRTGSHINAKFKGQNRKEFALFSLADATPLTSTSAERAAARIIEACVRGDSELVITLQAKVAAQLRAVAPELVAGLLSLTNQFLPAPGGIGTRSVPGSESTSPISPSVATTLIDEASVDNNEL